MHWTIYSFFTDIATIRRQREMALPLPRKREVPVTKVKLLRSRMIRKRSRPVLKPSEGGDPFAQVNPKPGKAEKRPLGIPVMETRGHQALVKLALEPEWEAKFEANSYGFRPGRCCQDAIAAIYIFINQKAKYVLDADLKGCFDNINHEALLRKLNTYPAVRRVIKAWLKAGAVDNGVFEQTISGTPQGGLCKALHKPPYAKQVTMQRDVRKTVIFGHFQLNSFA